MENLIEKLKGLDKKVWIGVGIAAAVLILLIVVLLVGSGDSKPSGSTQGSSQGNSQVGTQVGTQAGTEGIGTENLGTEVIGTEMETEITTETEMGTETEMTESESQSESESESQSQNNNQGGNNVTQPEDVGGVEQSPVTTTPSGDEILGVGTKDNPYEDIPDSSTMTLTTVSVPAGQTLYYKIQRTAGMWFEISDPDLYVIDSAGKRHDSSFQVENGLASDFILFQIGNKGGAAKAFTLKFYDVKGSWENPEKLSGNGPFTKHLNAGDDVGYYYSMKAAQTGTLRIYMSATANSEMNIQNTDPNVTIARKFSEDVQTDDQGRNYIDFPVKAGEEIRIHVQAIKPTRGSIPATDITFEFAYQ